MDKCLTGVTITGADDMVDVPDLQWISHRFPYVEWALLYYPEKEGLHRNPVLQWRERFLQAAEAPASYMKTALHLCGKKVFEDILSGKVFPEFMRYGRVQVNINARKEDFTRDEVLQVYRKLTPQCKRLILQYHADSQEVINQWFHESFVRLGTKILTDKVADLLIDTSRGRGMLPETWEDPPGLTNTELGKAGGINPYNVVDVCQALCKNQNRYRIDMESGVRTNDELDLFKVMRVLHETKYFVLGA